MKKKVKLFTTIASLCLAVALMAFGVYAATQVHYDITSKVTYTVDPNIKATVTYDQTYTNIYNDEKTAARDNVTGTPIWSNTDGNAANVTDGEVDMGTLDLKPMAFDVDMVYYYDINFTNEAAETDAYTVLKIVITDYTTVANTAGYSVEFLTDNLDAVDGETGAYTLPRTETGSYTIKVTVDPDREIPADGLDLSSAFTLSMVKA